MRLATPATLKNTCSRLLRPTRHRRAAPPRCQQQQKSSSNNQLLQRDDLCRTLAETEALLQGMSCGQLASTLTWLQQTYRAAALGALAGATTISEVVEFVESELPDQSWLLTFRAAVSHHLGGQPPAETGDDSPAVVPAAVPPATGTASSRSCSACLPQHLSQILSALAGLPVQVVQPLPSECVGLARCTFVVRTGRLGAVWQVPRGF